MAHLNPNEGYKAKIKDKANVHISLKPHPSETLNTMYGPQ